MYLNKICILKTFNPPVVEPAHPPMNIRIKNNTEVYQFSKLSLTYPVPEIIEIVLNVTLKSLSI